MQITVRTKEFGEALQSDVIRDLINNRLRDREDKRELRIYNWNAITDKDLKYTNDVKEALKASKRGALVLYFSTNPNSGGYGRKDYMYNAPVKPATFVKTWIKFDHAYIIENPERFETAELQKQRIEARKDALALMDDWNIAQQNHERYRDILSLRRLTKYLDTNTKKYLDDYDKLIDEFSSIIKFLVNKIYDSPEDNVFKTKYDIKFIKDRINELSKNLSFKILDIEQDIRKNKSLEQPNPSDLRWISSDIKEVTDQLQKMRDYANELKKKYLAE